MAKKHFIVTFENDKAQTTETLTWARENFPNYNEKTTYEKVYIYLADERGFRLVSDDEKFVCYNFNSDVILHNNDLKILNHQYTNSQNYFIEFSINNDIITIMANDNVVKLEINNRLINIRKPKLRDIAIDYLHRDINFLYNDNDNEENTNSLAKKIFDYLITQL
jgi:hypothetical protein